MDKIKSNKMPFVIIITIIFCGCTSIVSPTPVNVILTKSTPPPIFYLLEPKPGAIGDFITRICVYMQPSVIWESGDSSTDIRKTIDSSFQLLFNDIEVSRLGYPIYFGGEELVSDKENSILLPSFAETCIKVDMVKGPNTAYIAVMSTSKRVYTYSWSFTVENILPYDDDVYRSQVIELSLTATYEALNANNTQ